jgi:hypothetical protein
MKYAILEDLPSTVYIWDRELKASGEDGWVAIIPIGRWWWLINGFPP